jgi:hypothetical protein
MNRYVRFAVLAGLFLGRLHAADSALDAALDTIAPDLQKWATVCVVRTPENGPPQFEWQDYGETGSRTNFWPASTVKLYAVVAALELLHEHGLSLDVVVTFEHREPDGTWRLDCARTIREMVSEVFRRSSNEDYTLLLRMTGIDRINGRFLVPARGFPHSALMRGYVKEPPWAYVRAQPQRIRVTAADGTKSAVIEHTWSGRSYSRERGGTIIDADTGNVTSPRELADCLRRVLFHEFLPETERFRISAEQLEFLRHGGAGWTGLETRGKDSGPIAWTVALETLWPDARFYHKCGVISDYALEVACLDARAQGGPCFIVVPVIHAGSATKPRHGERLIGEMSLAIGRWIQERESAR